MKRFCFRKPVFPPYGYVGGLTIVEEGTIIGVYQLSPIFTSLAEFQFSIYPILHEMKHPQMLGDQALLYPVVFEKEWKLKKEYWEQPTETLQGIDRQKLFIGVGLHHEMYKLLATPRRFTKPYTELSAALPFLSTTKDESIEQFMLHSTFPVHESASHAAIYRFEQPYGIEWKTGTILKKQPFPKTNG